MSFREGEILNGSIDFYRFIKLSDGWIGDMFLGIDWGPSSDKTMNWEDAKEYCLQAGARLPNRFELLSLVDDTKDDPAINPIFSDTKTLDWYWTSTTHCVISNDAHMVLFHMGSSNCFNKGGSGYVRPVRPSLLGRTKRGAL